MKQIVVPVDGSEPSNHAARFAAQLARETGAALTLLYVYDAPAAAMLGFGALTTLQMESTKESVARGSFDAAHKAIDDAKPAVVQTHFALGHPGTEITSFAKSVKADLIVMGSRGMSAVAGLLMGSVGEYVVRHASCPVTIVR